MNKFFIENYLNVFYSKKFNFTESVDLNINFLNKKNITINNKISLIHSINENKKFLLLCDYKKNNKNIFFGEYYLKKYLNKEIFFNKIYFEKKYIDLILFNNLNKKFGKKYLIKNLNDLIEKILSKDLLININKKNFLNFSIGNTNFEKNMLKENYYFVVNNIKKIFFKNNILLKKVNISTTMGKSFVLK